MIGQGLGDNSQVSLAFRSAKVLTSSSVPSPLDVDLAGDPIGSSPLT